MMEADMKGCALKCRIGQLAKEYRHPLEAEKFKQMVLSKRNQSYQILDFSPVEVILDF